MNNFLLVDITATVRSWLADPSSNNGVALALTGATGYFSFESKEGIFTSHEPELEIVLSSSSGTGGGTVSSVGSGLGLTGGPITTTGTLNIDTNVVPQLGAANNVFTGNISALSFSGNGAALTNVNAASLNGVAGYNFPSLVGSNNFVGNQTITGNLNIAGIGSTLNVGGPSIFNMDITPGAAVTSNCLVTAGTACTGFQFNGLSGNNIFNAQINGTTEFNVDGSGNMTLNGLLNFPVTSANSGVGTTGVLTLGGASFAHAYGVNGLNSQNTFFGANAGNFTMTGELNLAIGAGALASNTSGQGNTAVGSPPPHAVNAGNRGGALGSNTTGSGNTAVGSPHSDPSTHTSNSSGSLSSNTTGSDNTSVGASALGSNTIGNNNVALGSLAGLTLTPANANTTGSSNTFVGYDSGPGASTEIDNATAVGANALVNCSNCIVLGDSTASMMVGIGTTAPQATLDVEAPSGTSPTVNFGNSSNPAKFTVNGLTASITGLLGVSEKSGPSSIAIGNGGVALTSPLNQLNGPTIINGPTTIGGSLTVAGTCTGCGGGGGIASVTGTNGVNATTSGGTVTLSANQGVLAFQTDLTAGITTAETFATNAATTAQNNAVTYANAVFVPLHGGTMLGPLNILADGLTAGGNQLVLAGGNVGIGTATPASTLDVNGTVNAANSFNLGGISFDYGSSSSNNAFLGFAGNGANPGTGNIAAGWHALAADTTGGSNVAAGYLALNRNTTGSFNVALGNFAGQTGDGSPMTGNNNTFLGGGAEASYGSNSSGAITNATAIGSNSVVGENNALVLGSIAGQNSATNSINVGIGTSTPQATFDVEAPSGKPSVNFFGSSPTPGTFTVNGSLSVTGAVTCGSGCGGGGGGGGAITGITPGAGLTGGGTSGNVTLSLLNPGPFATLNGNSFGGSQTVSGNVTATGTVSGAAISGATVTGTTITGTTLSANTLKAGALYLNGNTLSPFAYASGSGRGDNVFLGFAGQFNNLNPGDFNTAVGNQALHSNSGCCGFGVASDNTATGGTALFNNTTGAFNTASGASALYNNSTGSNNTAIGYSAGMPSVSANTTGSNNTFLGANSGPGAQPALDYATAIGANAVVGESNSLVLGSILNQGGCSSTGVPACQSARVGIGTSTPQATFDVEAPSGKPSVNFFGSSPTPGTFTVNGSLTVTGTCTGCGGGGSGGGITSVTGTNGVNASTSGGAVTLSLNTAATNTFTGTQTFNVPTGNGIVAETAGNSDAGISGSNTSAVGPGAGVAGFTVSGSGSGVVGTNSSSSLGGGYGVQGLSFNAVDPGVGGINNSTAAGGTYGVFGQSLGATGTGVYGTGNGSGVTGNASSPAGSGVVGTNFSTSGNAYGLYGQSSSPTGTGVFGSGNGTGVTGTTSSPTGYGVVGQSNGTTSGSAGVYGSATTAAGIGVLGSNNAGGYAGFFSGPVAVQGILQSTGDVNFQGNAAVAGYIAVTGNTTVGGTLAIGGDTPMSHSPRMWFSGFLPGNLGNSPVGGLFAPDQAVFVTRLTFTTNSPGSNCTTPAQVALVSLSGSGTLYSVSMGSRTIFDSGPITPPIPIPASSGTLSGGFAIQGVPASGCIPVTGQSASDVNVSVQYVMQ